MTEHDTGGPAYPCDKSLPLENTLTGEKYQVVHRHTGMTLLDEFAKAAMQGMMANNTKDLIANDISRYAYNQATAMLAEKRRREGGTT